VVGVVRQGTPHKQEVAVRVVAVRGLRAHLASVAQPHQVKVLTVAMETLTGQSLVRVVVAAKVRLVATLQPISVVLAVQA